MLQETVGLYSFLRVAAEITFAGLHHLSLKVRVPCGCKHDGSQQLFVHNRPWANQNDVSNQRPNSLDLRYGRILTLMDGTG